QQLSAIDSAMGKLIQYIGTIEIPLRTDYFSSLVRSIVGQQISVAAASAVFERLKTLTGNKLNVTGMSNVTDDALHEIGFSKRKIQYVRDLIAHIERKDIILSQLPELDNSTIIKKLTSVKGI